MNVLIQGLGSIAEKHIYAIRQLNPEVKIYALRSGKGARDFAGVINLEKLDDVHVQFDFAIISNPTKYHLQSILNLLELNIPLFIEKPVFNSLKGLEGLLEKVERASIPTYVACNMRFLPVIRYLKEVFKEKQPLEIRCYCGSYLPDWRPSVDYRMTYSANADLGGGVHLDLIHELDYLYFLLGKPVNSRGFIGNISDLDINSVDYAHYHLSYADTMASVTLNYFRKTPKRDIEIVFRDVVWSVNLLTSCIIDEYSGVEVFKTDVGIKESYLDQMRYFQLNALADKKMMNDLREAIEVLKICLNETT